MLIKNKELNILSGIKNRAQFMCWMQQYHLLQPECWIVVKMGNPANICGVLAYLDAVEVALCFGWIDSVKKKIHHQVFSTFFTT